MDFKQIADKVLGMLQRADGNDPSRGHLTMNNWEWPTGVALYGIYKTYQESGDKAILDYLSTSSPGPSGCWRKCPVLSTADSNIARCGTSTTSNSGATRCSWCACSWPKPVLY